MLRLIKLIIAIILATILAGYVSAQSATDLIAPNIFVRGIQLPQGVRYTASFIKPVENAALQNISVEITLPAESQFTEMLVSRQVQFHVVRKNRQRQLTLIWQISRLAADQPLDSFSFTMADPLAGELEFYMQWQTAEGEQRIEDFFEVPPVVVATQAQAQATMNQAGFEVLGDTGIQVSAPAGVNLSAQILAIDFNPPAQYGKIWWCSLLQLDGLPSATTAEVIMPLRRSLAPFTALQLFQQQADGSWTELAGQGVVTADGQYVIYTHPGGIVATGGPEEIQPEAVPASEVPVVEESAPASVDNQQPVDNTAPPADNPPPASDKPSGDNTNQVIVQPTAAPPAADNVATSSDTSSNGAVPTTFVKPTLAAPAVTPITIVVVPTNAPIQATATNVKNGNATFTNGTSVPAAPTRASSISDGTSNTIIVSEVTRTAVPDGSVPFLTTRTLGSGVTDGTSNTIIVSEATRTARPDGSVPFLPTRTLGSGVSDGTSNTIIVSEVTRTALPDGSVPFLPTRTSGSGVTDGTSNTIIVSEVTRTALPDGSVPFLPTRTLGSGVTDGTSNTINISEGTRTALPDGSVPFLPTRTLSSGVSDGTSNTIIISEVTRTALPDGSVPFLPTRTLGSGVTDGTSNTIIVSEATRTALPDGSVPFLPTPTSPSLVTAKPTQKTNGVSSASPTPVLTSRPTLVAVTVAPPVFSPVKGTVTTQPFGVGGIRVEILRSSSSVLQCQAGQVNCSVLNRRVGTGLR